LAQPMAYPKHLNNGQWVDELSSTHWLFSYPKNKNGFIWIRVEKHKKYWNRKKMCTYYHGEILCLL